MPSDVTPPAAKEPAPRKRASKKAAQSLPVVGWREWVALPDLGMDALKAKVDTGARSSSLHAVDIRTEERDGVSVVRFTVPPRTGTDGPSVDAEAVIHDRRTVRSSNGKATERIVIVTAVTMLGQTWPVEVTLADRTRMTFRMLLGRQAVRGHMLVDAGNSYYGGNPETPPSDAAS